MRVCICMYMSLYVSPSPLLVVVGGDSFCHSDQVTCSIRGSSSAQQLRSRCRSGREKTSQRAHKTLEESADSDNVSGCNGCWNIK